MVGIEPKKTDFLAHLKRFFVYALLRPTSYTPRFCQELMKLHNRGKFHKYNIYGCQVINFQMFSYRFRIHEMAYYGRFWNSLSPK